MKKNRRSFIKGITGFLVGIYAAFVPKAKAEEWTFVNASYNGKGNSDDIEIYPKRSGTKFIAEIPNAKGLSAEDICNMALEKIETKTIPWKSLGCIDCYRECCHWDECIDILEKLNIESEVKWFTLGKHNENIHFNSDGSITVSK